MKIHFIGIGGIGMSALAKYYLYNGHTISGSDLDYPSAFSKNEFENIKFFKGHKKSNLEKGIDLVIYTSAIKDDNPELVRAKNLGIKTLSYPEALGQLTKNYFTIAVAGMHGKSTTTAMIANILIKAGLDPTVIIGSKVRGFGLNGEPSNFRLGKSKFLVIEADEYKAGFLNHYPDIILITNIEEEHLDYFKNFNNILKTFQKFIKRLKIKKDLESGFKRYLVLNKDDAGLKKLITKGLPKGIRVKFYSLRKKPKNLKLSIPGLHNLSNALGALEIAKIFHIKQKLALEALKGFTGIWRRLEFKGRLNGAMIFDDYGHHPTEIKATCRAARELIKNGRLFLVFQPHQYYRVLTLFDKFLNAFDLADFLILTDIYSVPGRESEEIKKKISSKILFDELSKIRKNVYYIQDFKDIEHFLKNNLKRGDICVIMGAGNIWQLTEKLIKDFLNKR
jgi:UDP-N-acetylmuramate--alanine ligase